MSDSTSMTVDYMTLLVTQLTNQNPLDPMDTNDMAAQLAEFSQLSELEEINSSFSDTLTMVQQSYASSLLGQEVSYSSTDEDDNTTTGSGTVTEIEIDDDVVSLLVGDTEISLEDILSVGASE